ncbi:MAG: GntR family transcriptional regulator [Albidovulum sp.]|nr:GntR family transcriptional regulator [Albidovulum sp.]MDE0306758.1 GntR family transcriptional regulator [Albidovulum sp.]
MRALTGSFDNRLHEGNSESELSLADSATRFLRDRILDLTLSPGERLDEKMLLAKYELSRTPLREAINRLMAEGLVESSKNRGVYVSSMDLESVLELLDAYVLSERMVASVCIMEEPGLLSELREIQRSFENAVDALDLLEVTEWNARFHCRIAEACDNRFIFRHAWHLHNLARRTSFYIYLRENREKGEFYVPSERIHGHHRRIIECISSRNRSNLIDSMTEHALVFRERLVVLVKGADLNLADFGLELAAAEPETA